MVCSKSLYDEIVAFLAMPQLPFTPILQKAPINLQPSVPPGLSLFAHMLANDPEIRAQEALFPYLLSLHPSTKREAPFPPRRKLDFFVKDSSDDPGVVVELKHYSPHQGGFASLLGPAEGKNFTLHGDLQKSRPDVPLIQVALYTAVEEAGPMPSTNPFVKKYVRHPVSSKGYAPPARTVLGAAITPPVGRAEYTPVRSSRPRRPTLRSPTT